jgi:alkylation response protein AidB-like acyl-CoA dehydrogenase
VVVGQKIIFRNLLMTLSNMMTISITRVGGFSPQARAPQKQHQKQDEVMSAIHPQTTAQTVAASVDKSIALQDYARSLIPTLKARSKETAALGRLPAETIADLEAGGLLSMTTPRQFGGDAVSVRTFLNWPVPMLALPGSPR